METYSDTFEIFDTKLNKLYNTANICFRSCAHQWREIYSTLLLRPYRNIEKFPVSELANDKKRKKKERERERREEYEAFETGETGMFSGFSLEKTFHPRGIHGVDFKPTKESGPNERTENYPDTGDSAREKREKNTQLAIYFFCPLIREKWNFPWSLEDSPNVKGWDWPWCASPW